MRDSDRLIGWKNSRDYGFAGNVSLLVAHSRDTFFRWFSFTWFVTFFSLRLVRVTVLMSLSFIFLQPYFFCLVCSSDQSYCLVLSFTHSHLHFLLSFCHSMPFSLPVKNFTIICFIVVYSLVQACVDFLNFFLTIIYQSYFGSKISKSFVNASLPVYIYYYIPLYYFIIQSLFLPFSSLLYFPVQFFSFTSFIQFA
jgi:hypothetical protein